MTAAVRLARNIRERFTRRASPTEALCYEVPRTRVPVSAVIINNRVVVLESEPEDRAALEAMGAEVRG